MKELSLWLIELEQEDSFETWQISAGCSEDFTNDVGQWAEFVKAAFDIRQSKVPRDPVHSSYLWHDEQASQLRFATSPCDQHNLPFGCTVRLVARPEPIISSWLAGPEFIRVDDLIEVPSGQEIEDPPEYVLPVWVCQHPGP